MADYEFIRYEVAQGRARITLNRPDKCNALSMNLLQELHHALWRADDEKAVHAIVIKGAGSCFSSGYDLDPAGRAAPTDGVARRDGNLYAEPTIDDDSWRLERAQSLRMAIFDLHKPVIAQVHGYCLAGGTDIALLCDMVIVADDAVIGFPAARDLGSLPNQMWLYHAGPQWAKRLLLTGDTVTGVEAAQIGLALKSVPLDDLEAECEGLLDRLALIDPDLLSSNKRVVNLGMELMGARTLQRLAAENDARAHRAPATQIFKDNVKTKGLKAALKARDGGFGDGRARVNGAEHRDANGRLID